MLKNENGKKAIGLYLQNNNFARAITLFVSFCTTKTWNSTRFMEMVDTTRISSFS